MPVSSTTTTTIITTNKKKKDRVELTVPYLKFFFLLGFQRSTVGSGLSCLALRYCWLHHPPVETLEANKYRLNASFYVGEISFLGDCDDKSTIYTYTPLY